ncbi:hypothetical protein ACWOFR_16510 [Carnobacterium gallinarum]|uniref:hypothetical protein n=1 Tax=Carnobacterium gallinarum TaxID=2749 RepID=UPI000553AB0C|nr:hypothetical protein [Carnobacterium gallinarum]
MLQNDLVEKRVRNTASMTKARDIKVAKYLLRKQFPVQQVLDATSLDPKELSQLIKTVRKEEYID